MKKIYIIIFTTLLALTGCITRISNIDDLLSSINTYNTSECKGCKSYKTYSSKIVAFGESTPRDEMGGEIVPNLLIQMTNSRFAVTSKDHLFKFPLPNEYLSDGYPIKNSNASSDPWRFIVVAKFAGKFQSIGMYRAYVLSGDAYIPLPALYQKGFNTGITCSTGYPACNWEESYIIPTSLVDSVIASRAPLKLFFKYEASKTNSTIEPLNEHNIAPKSGAIVQIKSEYIAAFVHNIFSRIGQ